MDRQYKVFISHAGPDKQSLAIPLYHRLRSHNIHAFLDREQLHPGDNGPRVMQYAMNTAPIGIFILSPEFPARSWTMAELMCFQAREQHAIAKGKPVPKLIPVFYRLGVRECRDVNLFYRKNDRGESVFLENGYFERVLKGKITMQQVLEAMKLLSLRTGIENHDNATNDDTSLMSERREALLDRMVDAILKVLPETQRTTHEEDSAVTYWRRVELQKANIRTIQSSKSLATSTHATSTASFTPHFDVWRNPRYVSLLIDDDRLDCAQPAPEATTKAILLNNQADDDLIVVQGMPGVGKTCMLRALCHDRDIRNRFSDGIYVITLGSDATSNTFTIGLMRAIASAGGAAKAEEAANIATTDAVIKAACNWFNTRTCLFLVDDLWSTHGLGIRVLEWLSEIAVSGTQSAIIVSTREKDLVMHKTVSHKVLLTPHEPRSLTSRRILLQSATHDPEWVIQDATSAALNSLLDVCAGLPVALSVTGRSIGRISLDMGQDIDRAIHAYLDMREELGEYIIDQDVDDYQSLSFALKTSLRILQQRTHESADSTPPEYSFDEKHRSLCVLQKQQWVPMSMLCRLWKMPSTIEVSLAVGNMSEVGLLDVSFKKCGEMEVKGIRLHDLVHDFAIKEARLVQAIDRWHLRLLRNYDCPVDKSDSDDMVCRAWWMTNAADGSYVQENIIRHLIEAGDVEEALVLVGRPLWIVNQLYMCGILILQQDFDTLQRHVMSNEINPFGSQETKQELDLLLNAIRMSFIAVKDNPREIFFQLCSRLISARESSNFLRSIFDYAATHSLKPSLRPVTPILRTSEELQGRLYHCKEATCVAIIDEEGFVIAGTKNGQIQVFDIESCELKREWQAHNGEVSDIAVTKDKRLVVSNSNNDKRIRVFDRMNDYREKAICRFPDEVWGFALTPDSKSFVAGCGYVLSLWDLESGRCVNRRITWLEMKISSVAVAPNGRLAAAGALGGNVRVAEISLDESPLDEFYSYDSWLLQACQKGIRYLTQKVAYLTGNPEADSTNTTPPGYFNLSPLMNKVDRICFTPNGSHLLTASRKTIKLWKIGTTIEVSNLTLESGTKIPVKVGLSTSLVSEFTTLSRVSELSTTEIEGRSQFMTAGMDGQAGIYSMDHSPVSEVRYADNGEDIEFACFSTRGDKLFWGQPNWIRMTDVGDLVNTQSSSCKHDGPVAAMCVTPDGNHVVTGGEDGKVMVWDCQTGKQKGKVMGGHAHFVSSVGVTPDGRKIVSAGRDYKAIVWDLNNQEKIAVLEGHTENIEMMQVTLDGRYAITGSKDKTVRAWDLETSDGKHTVLEGHKSEVRRVYLPQDEDKCLSLSHTEGILWDLLTKEKISVVEEEDICFFKEDQIERIFDLVLVRTNVTRCRLGDAIIERSPSWKYVLWKHGSEVLVMATMDTMAYRLELSPSNRTVCIGLNSGHVSILRLDLPGTQDVIVPE